MIAEPLAGPEVLEHSMVALHATSHDFTEATAILQPLPALQDTLLQVRTGKIKPFFNQPSPSAIYKSPRPGRITVTILGCEGDEHAFHKHGGPDKAFLHYCSAHYEAWQKEMPDYAHRFHIGGFGENLVSEHLNEHNVCIGDIFRIGSEVKFQVTEPRMPCYKLNHRFQIQAMSTLSQDKRRTGFYCRILQTGTIEAGEQITLLKRPNPKWTVANMQHYLHTEKKNFEVMKELAALPELGQEIRDLFISRLKKKMEDESDRLTGQEQNMVNTWRPIRIVKKDQETPRIASFVLETANKTANADQPILPGSHVRLQLPGKLIRAYSVVGGTNSRFEVGIALEPNSRGGSKYLHEVAKVGDIISASPIVSSFPLSPSADHQVLIAGGIGITAFIAAAESLQQKQESYTLHLAVRSSDAVPFRSRLEKLGKNLVIHDKSSGQPLDLGAIIGKAKGNTHFYCCGPERLMAGLDSTATDYGIPKANVHFEAFQVATGGDPFTVRVVNKNKTIDVGAAQTLLEALQEAGLDIPSSCEAGSCETCHVRVCNGRIEHRGTGLSETERQSMMLSCVSRGVGHIEIETGS